jgi:hypothetical protein
MVLECCYVTVSGGFFVSQMAILASFIEAKGSQFDFYFGASGGNLSCLTALLSNGTFESVQAIGNKLKSSLFVQNWFRGLAEILPSAIAGVFMRSGLYRNGFDSERLVKDLFQEDFLLRDTTPEIWTLTYNKTIDSGAIFCTKKESKLTPFMNAKHFSFNGCEEITYIGGDTDLLSKVTMATAAIPTIRSPVTIGKYQYVDGGVSRSCPGSLFNETLVEYHYHYPGPVHYLYILSCKISDIETRKIYAQKTSEHWIIQVQDYIKNFVTSMVYSDHQLVFENWLRIIGKRLSECKHDALIRTNIEELRMKLNSLKDKHYFITAFTDDASVDIANFESEDFNKAFEKARITISFIIFFI